MGQLAGGPKIPLRFGRKDVDQPEGCAPEGNLPAGGAPWPAPAKGPGDHLRQVFYRMGFSDQEIVALSGARPPSAAVTSMRCGVCRAGAPADALVHGGVARFAMILAPPERLRQRSLAWAYCCGGSWSCDMRSLLR